MKRAQELTPGAQEQAAVLNLVTKIQSVLDNLVVAPSLFEAAVCVSVCVKFCFCAFFIVVNCFTYMFVLLSSQRMHK